MTGHCRRSWGSSDEARSQKHHHQPSQRIRKDNPLAKARRLNVGAASRAARCRNAILDWRRGWSI